MVDYEKICRKLRAITTCLIKLDEFTAGTFA